MIIRQSVTILALLSFLLLSSCSNSDKKEEEKVGVIKETTDAIAHEAVARIQSPIDKANAVKDLHEKHEDDIQKAVE